MDASARQMWLPPALLVGVGYIVIGRVFALPSDNVRVWRLAAWLLSAALFATHIWHEHFRQRSPPRSTALHVAAAVAVGGFGIAVAGMIHSVSAGSGIRPTWLLALLLFPVITAVPAFLVALGVTAILSRRN